VISFFMKTKCNKSSLNATKNLTILKSVFGMGLGFDISFEFKLFITVWDNI